jgi:DNA-binding response OmpR family regulator
LVVDDQPAALYAAAKLLQREGFKTLEAFSGSDAVNLAREVDGLLVDVNLPDLNGVAVCRAVKQQSPLKPVILMSTVYSDELHQEASKHAGADLYLVPPLNGGEVAAAFDRLLSR